MKQRRSLGGCSHSSTITTVTAGLARDVCEVCSNVSVRYVEPAVRLHPDVDRVGSSSAGQAGPTAADLEEAARFEAIVTFEESSRLIRCGLCSEQAFFMIPGGLRCDEHAWQAARFDWDDADPWVPIRINKAKT